MSTAVLILGFHVNSVLRMPDGRERGWHDLVIGPQQTPQFDEGRATHGIRLAHRLGADITGFSTGASEKDGLKEGEYTRRKVIELADQIGPALGISGEEIRTWMNDRGRVLVDIESQTTLEELRRNLPLCRSRGIRDVHIVTNEFHLPRALNMALQVRRELCLRDLEIHGSAPYDETPLPTIFEVPTRPDRNGVDLRPLLGIFGVKPEKQAAALAAALAAIHSYKA